MRPALLVALLAVALVGTGCTASSPDRPGAPDPTEPGVSLTTEQDRLVDELSRLPGIADLEVRLRSGATFGRQVIIEATGDGSGDGLDIVDELTRAGWHTLAFVPTEVRATLILDGGNLTPLDLGFDRRGADPAGLYDRYGPPAADESWRP